MIWGRFLKNKATRGVSFTPSWRGLILQLFLITVLPLTLLLIAFTFGSLVLHQQAMRTLVGERDELAVRTAASAIAEQVRQRETAVRLLSAKAQEAQADQLKKLLATVNFLQTDFESGVAFFDKNGELRASSGDLSFWESSTADLAPAVRTLIASSDANLVVIDGIKHPQTGEQLIAILVADSGRQLVTAGAFSAAGMARRILSIDADGQSPSYLLVDGERETIYRTGYLFSEDNLRSHAGIAEALNGESGATYQRVGDSEHVVAYSPVEPFGWALVSEEPWEMVDTPMLRTTLVAPLVLAPVLILALVALWFAARQIMRPLQDLETKSALLAAGNFQAIEAPVGGIAEIRRLQTGLIQMAQQVKEAQQSLHRYIGAITAAQEEERRRLARELHDETIQSLIALKQRVQLRRLARQNDQEVVSLEEIEFMTEQTIEELRRLTRAMRPIYLEDLGLVAALEMLVSETSQATGIPVEFNSNGVERRLEPTVELALYRMAQESLNNVARHAGATQADLQIDFSPQAVILRVTDDGKGFIVPQRLAELAPSGHFGLLGLYERSEMIGGRLEIKSSPGKGSQLIIHVPLTTEIE